MSCYCNSSTIADVCLGVQDPGLISEYSVKFLYRGGVRSLV